MFSARGHCTLQTTKTTRLNQSQWARLCALSMRELEFLPYLLKLSGLPRFAFLCGEPCRNHSTIQTFASAHSTGGSLKELPASHYERNLGALSLCTLHGCHIILGLCPRQNPLIQMRANNIKKGSGRATSQLRSFAHSDAIESSASPLGRQSEDKGTPRDQFQGRSPTT